MGNTRLFSLPNSNLRLIIATARIKVDKNYKNRKLDFLFPDYNLDPKKSLQEQIYKVIQTQIVK